MLSYTLCSLLSALSPWSGARIRRFLSHRPLLISALEATLRFNELVRLLEQNGFRLIREKGSIRYYAKAGVDRLIRVDYHGAKEIPTGTCNAILKAAGLKAK